MKETSAMVINRETAMLLWNKSFGKSSKVKDFAGREMIKAAYSDRGSKYGWNIDHIYPQSKGGKTTESNLICCHILTNDEKADKTCFTANDKKFEVVKVQNHYEIKQTKNTTNSNDETNSDNDDVNFFDSAAGVRFFKDLKGIQNKPIFVGTIVIDLYGITTTAIIDFINEIFYDKNVVYSPNSRGSNAFGLFTYGNRNSDIRVVVKDYNMPQKEDISDLLDKCILLNTYLGHYFKPREIISGYQIFYGVHTFENKIKTLSSENDMYGNSVIVSSLNSFSLVINELVKINTEANEKIDLRRLAKDMCDYSVYGYDYIYTKLAENLKKLK